MRTPQDLGTAHWGRQILRLLRRLPLSHRARDLELGRNIIGVIGLLATSFQRLSRVWMGMGGGEGGTRPSSKVGVVHS